MKTLWMLIKGFFKLILVLACVALVFSIIFLSLVYFSKKEQYNDVIQSAFVMAVGEKVNIQGGVEVSPGRQMNTTFKDSTITIETRAGEFQAFGHRFNLTIPWNAMFSQNIDLKKVEGEQIKLSFLVNNKVTNEYDIESVSANLKKTCCDLIISDIIMVSKQGEATGELTVFLNESSIRLTGNMASKKWTLDKEIDPTSRVFPIQGLDDINGDFKFHIDTLVLPTRELKNVEAVVDLKLKTLKVISSDK